MSSQAILGTIELSLLFSILALGIFISFRILNFPDLSVDGTFTLGCVVSAVLTTQNHPILAIVVATMAGALAGSFTGFLNTKMNVQYILAGILTMTGLYSLNLKIATGIPNISLFGSKTIFKMFQDFLSSIFGTSSFITQQSNLILIFIVLIVLSVLLYYFFKTQCGLAIRASGDNEEMVRASSISTDAMKIIALALSNALVALCASLYTQHQMYYDISQGIGMMVVGLTSIIVGESIFGKRTILNSFVSLILGSLTYRFLLTFALSLGMDPNDWKLLCALLVAFVISLPTIKNHLNKRRKRHA